MAIRAGSDDFFRIETGLLYPALHRLEKQGWIQSEWGVTENSQRAKFYRLTASGRKQLSSGRSRWDQNDGRDCATDESQQKRGLEHAMAVDFPQAPR